MSRLTSLSIVALLLLLPAGATTTTQKIQLAPEEISREEVRQREIVLAEHREQEQRLVDLAQPILSAATPLCGADTAPRIGIKFANVWSYPEEWREAARRLGMGDTLEVIAVAQGSPAERAGLRAGDRLVRAAADSLPAGESASERMSEALAGVLEGWSGEPIPFVVERADGRHRLKVHPEVQCEYPVVLDPTTTLNAFADGERIYVTTTMMRFADDHELSVILAHELAHNAMGHIDAKRQNALLGALLGAVADVALSLGSGYSTGGAYAAEGAQTGGGAFSQDFETEADYVGLYALALAGIDLERAPNLWRHMALASPGSIGFASTHPTTVERFLRMQKTIEEIARKRELDEPLEPEPKDPGR